MEPHPPDLCTLSTTGVAPTLETSSEQSRHRGDILGCLELAKEGQELTPQWKQSLVSQGLPHGSGFFGTKKCSSRACPGATGAKVGADQGWSWPNLLGD